MFQLKEVNRNLIWSNDIGETKSISIGRGTYIYSSDTIFVMNENRDTVRVYDSNKQLITEIKNSDNIYLMYLQNYRKFGFSIVASVKIGNKWTDVYLVLDGDKFIAATKAC